MTIAVFDFDGTITKKDTFLEFTKFVRGQWRFWIGMIILSPVIVLYRFGFLNNGKAKQIVFRFFFRGMPVNEFNSRCTDFSDRINMMLKEKAVNALKIHQENGSHVIIVSASIENWITPWAEKIFINDVLATKIEIDADGCLTGYFLTPNCHGEEKKNRLLKAHPERSKYILHVYGDSSGDEALMKFADYSYYKCFT